MYVKRIRLQNYGPLRSIDLELPFDGQNPKPVMFVGENGTGKTLLLSHIVNGMIEAKHVAYSRSRETPAGKVFKMRDGRYITVGQEYYFARVDFEDARFIEEIVLSRSKPPGTQQSVSLDPVVRSAWNRVKPHKGDLFANNFESLSGADDLRTRRLVSSSCLLYLPADRFENPAWLGPAARHSRPRHLVPARHVSQTDRQVVCNSALRRAQDWLLDVALDRAALEARTGSVSVQTKRGTGTVPVWLGHRGDATNIYGLALEVIRQVVRSSSDVTTIGIGSRHVRRLAVMSDSETLVPDLFQLSSGEMALLGLFLSVLRDFDLRGSKDVPFAAAAHVRGLVVIDEVDLHLHTRHQYEVLPALIRMFPKVQFVMTTHSPLFILGLRKALGEDGFGLYELPSGRPVDPEGFGEFGKAYEAFSETASFLRDARSVAKAAEGSCMFVEGETDEKYISRASQLLGKMTVLDRFTVVPVGSDKQLNTLWKSFRGTIGSIQGSHLVWLHDPESRQDKEVDGRFHRWAMPKFPDHPIRKGVEHLFGKETLLRARRHDTAFVDIEGAHSKEERGKRIEIAEVWSINRDEKMNLCKWLCKHGTEEDFRNFTRIFDMLEELLAAEEAGDDAGEDSGP